MSSFAFELIENAVTGDQCQDLLASIQQYRRTHELPLIHRVERNRSLLYRVIDGNRIEESLPGIQSLYRAVHGQAREISGLDIDPLGNRTVAVNVNITPPGGEYRWHYDRNLVTAILFLNTCGGGETEIYPNYRLLLGRRKSSRLQRWLDRALQFPPVLWAFGTRVEVRPRPGLLMLMRGDRCLHSVRCVTGLEERINIIMSFDTADACFPQEASLDRYLYQPAGPEAPNNPNYTA